MLKLLAKFFSKADPFEWEEDDPEVTDLLLAIDSATTEAAKCAVDNDWSGVHRNQSLVGKLNSQLYEHRLIEELDKTGAFDGTDS